MKAVPAATPPDSKTEEQLRHACAELERRLRAGEECHAEQYLSALPQLAATVDQAADLIYAEFLTRLELGQLHLAEQFYRRFPSWKAYLQQQFAVHDWLRQSVAPTPLVSDESSATWQPPDTPGSNGAVAAKPPITDWPENYELLGEIARGGMGVVYKARQVGLNRLVALKMLKGERALVGDDLTRFRAEAEIIARLQHPHIVQIYEIGERQGCPFLALEYVPGGSLAQRLAKGPLSSEDAVLLVEHVAQAVQLAHQKGILHRDLKPGNILLATKSEIRNSKSETNPKDQKSKSETTTQEVSDLSASDCGYPMSDFVPKLTDFGLAKQIDATDPHTRTGAVVGTPTYMAPEQVTGKREDLGPHTDVYALGVILYECLTGRPPFQAALLLDLFEAIRGQEPVPPRRLQAKIPADVETICLKCLQKEPAKRYDSAQELADDLARFRLGEPIQARPVGRLERGWRWCKRNPVVASLLTLLALVLLAGTIVSTTFWWQAADNAHQANLNLVDMRREYQRAEENLHLAQQQQQRAERHYLGMLETVQDFYIQISQSKDLDRPGLTPLRRDLLTRALNFYEEVARKEGDEPTVRMQIARAQKARGEILVKLGRLPEAVSAFRHAITLLQPLVPLKPNDPGPRHWLAGCESLLGDTLMVLDRSQEALSPLQAALADFAEARRLDPASTNLQINVAKTYVNLGKAQLRLRQFNQAEEAMQQAFTILEPIGGAANAEPEPALELAQACFTMGALQQERGRYAAAQTWLERAQQGFARLLTLRPDSPALARDLARTHNLLGSNLRFLGKTAESVSALRQAEDLLTKLAKENPSVPDHHTGLAYTRQYLGEAYIAQGRREEGLQKLADSCAVLEALGRQQPLHYAGMMQLWNSCTAHTTALRGAKRSKEALEVARRAVAVMQELQQSDSNNSLHLHRLGGGWNNLALVYMDLGRFDDACQACHHAVHVQRQALTALPTVSHVRLFLSNHLLNLAQAERGRGQVVKALDAVREFQELWPKDGSKHVDAARQYAKCYAAVGQEQPTTGPEDDALRERCALAVVAALRDARRLGFRDLRELQTDKLYDPLRSRSDFQQVLTEFANKTTTNP